MWCVPFLEEWPLNPNFSFVQPLQHEQMAALIYTNKNEWEIVWALIAETPFPHGQKDSFLITSAGTVYTRLGQIGNNIIPSNGILQEIGLKIRSLSEEAIKLFGCCCRCSKVLSSSWIFNTETFANSKKLSFKTIFNIQLKSSSLLGVKRAEKWNFVFHSIFKQLSMFTGSTLVTLLVCDCCCFGSFLGAAAAAANP